MTDIFRKWTKTYNSRNSTGFETRNIKTVHYGFEIIVPLHPIRLAHQKIKDSENINVFKSNIEHWKPENCQSCFRKLYLWHDPRLLHFRNFFSFMNNLSQHTYLFKFNLLLHLNLFHKILSIWILEVLITWRLVDLYQFLDQWIFI